MHWITRDRPKVGRVGCSWIIRHFVDSAATFHFATNAMLSSDAERLGATIYHVDGCELSRRGNSSSFEVACEHYNLKHDNPALTLLCAIVNTADIPRGPAQEPEGPGLRATIDGILLLEPDDQQVLIKGWLIFDALYAYCQQKVQRQVH